MSFCYNCFREYDGDVCPYCGYAEGSDAGKFPLALPHGTILGGRYITGRVLGQGGFGITYVAQDYTDKKLVAVKEFFPEQLAMRSGSTVSTFSGEREDAYRYGKECFLSEAKTLSEFIGNPNIVRVYSYFEENGTVYFSMEYIDGVSLLEYIRSRGGRIPYEEAKNLLLPVMDALTAVHAKGIIHRDISPDNIFITQDGTVKLIDFGAARYSMGDRSRSLDVVLKHGYAPKEQYARHGRQGPYTDVYSLAATFYRAITGRIPPDSIDRLDEDSIILPSSLGSDIPTFAEDALLTALSVNPAERFQSMQAFKKALEVQPSEQSCYASADQAAGAYAAGFGDPAKNAADLQPSNGQKRKDDPPPALKPPQSSKKWVIPVVLSAVIAVAAVAVALIIILSPKGSSNQTVSPSSGSGQSDAGSDTDPAALPTPNSDPSPHPDPETAQPTSAGVVVKDYRDKDAESAKSELESQGFSVTLSNSYDNTIKKGRVISQSIPANTTVTETSPRITLTVSRGREHSTAGYDQKVVVTASSGSYNGTLKLYNWEEGEWVEKLSTPCTVGTNGITSSYGEGIPATPKGDFKLGVVISNVPLQTKMLVHHATYDTCIVDDTSSSLYNTIQDVNSLPSGVHYDRIGIKLTNGTINAQIFIEHNGDGYSAAPSRTKGSAITICGMSTSLDSTWGCIDISKAKMNDLLRLLDPSLEPHIITQN